MVNSNSPQPKVALKKFIHVSIGSVAVDVHVIVQFKGERNKTAASHEGQMWNTLYCRVKLKIIGNSSIE